MCPQDAISPSSPARQPGRHSASEQLARQPAFRHDQLRPHRPNLSPGRDLNNGPPRRLNTGFFPGGERFHRFTRSNDSLEACYNEKV
jgi:hypothetical protein